MRNTVSFHWSRTKTRFDTEAKSNLEVAYYDLGLSLTKNAPCADEYKALLIK